MEEENEEKNEDERDYELEEIQEEVMKEAREEELLVSRRAPTQPKGVKDGPSNPSPTHSKTKTLTQKFWHLIPGEKPRGCGEPTLEAPNYELRAFEEVV